MSSIYDKPPRKSTKAAAARKKERGVPPPQSLVSINLHEPVAVDILTILANGGIKELDHATPPHVVAAIMSRLSYETGVSMQRITDALARGCQVRFTVCDVDIFEASLPKYGRAAVIETLEQRGHPV